MKKILIITFVTMALFAVAVNAQDNIEKKKIEFLISSVQNLKGAKFIRNGAEYNSIEAAKHLTLKLQKAGDHVQSADDFIRLCASKSYITGQPYLIKFPDGKTISAEKYLRDKLKEYNINIPSK
ncbi:MAG: DUF5329 domain-containing protein [Deltaproteobacteria bacterium]|nr:DUF5329 domain-containing protein [Deltaproteobacteria bacterium]